MASTWRRSSFLVAVASVGFLVGLAALILLDELGVVPVFSAGGDQGIFEERVRKEEVARKVHAAALAKAGIGRFNGGDLKTAREEFEKALELYPETRDAHRYLALILKQEGDLAGALNHVNAFLVRAPDDEEMRKLAKEWSEAAILEEVNRKSNLLNKGNDLARAGKHEEAQAAFRKALELDPRYWHAHRNLAISLRETGNLEPARKHAWAAYELVPAEIANVLLWLSLCEEMGESAGNLKSNLEIARKAEKNFPRVAELERHLGRLVMAAEGDAAKAVAHYQTSLMLAPGQEKAVKALEQIAEDRPQLGPRIQAIVRRYGGANPGEKRPAIAPTDPAGATRPRIPGLPRMPEPPDPRPKRSEIPEPKAEKTPP